MDGLRAVVVGTSFGARVHVPALRAAGFTVVALVGRDPERTSARAAEVGVPLGTSDLAEALDRLGSGEHRCVTVATPPDAHVGPVLSAIDAGAHVLCEKPFALDTADAARMTDAAARRGVVALLGTEFRWATDEALTGRLIRSGAIGEPRLATFVQHSGLVARGLHGAFNEEWWFDAGRGGGLLNAAGVHYLDRFRTWLGPVAGVSASVQVVGDRPPTAAEDTYTALLRFTSGATGLVQHCGAAPGTPGRTCRVVGPGGSVWFDPEGVWLDDGTGTRRVPVPDDLVLPAPPPRRDDPEHAFTTIELPPYTRLAERFRDLVLGHPVDPAAPPTPTFADGLEVQRVVDAVRTSAAAGGTWVELPSAR